MMKISINPDLEQYITEKVAAGQFDSPSDVVNGALEVMRREETLSAADIEEIRAEIATGIEQADRGEISAWDLEAIKAAVRSRLGNNS